MKNYKKQIELLNDLKDLNKKIYFSLDLINCLKEDMNEMLKDNDFENIVKKAERIKQEEKQLRLHIKSLNEKEVNIVSCNDSLNRIIKKSKEIKNVENEIEVQVIEYQIQESLEKGDYTKVLELTQKHKELKK